MSRWFRLYDETLNDPKILKLSDKLHRIWIGVLCVASKNNGTLPPLGDMALLMRMKPLKIDEAINKLIKSGLIDDDGASLKPHNWNGRQYKSDVSTERVKRFRNSQRNVSVAPPDTEQNRGQKDAAKQPPFFEVARETSPPSPDAELYARGKQVLGKTSGGLIASLLKSKQGNVALARAAIEQASTKNDAREYIGRIIAAPAAANERHGINDPHAGII